MLNYSSWVHEKIKIAQAIASGCCGGGYDESALIICATISAMAALAWPGKNKIDMKRFVEILVQVARYDPNPLRISIPLLHQEDHYFADLLPLSKKAFYLTESNDKDFSELTDFLKKKSITMDPEKTKTVKHNSYAFLLYNQIRCGFAHEYIIGENATSFDAMRNIGNVKENAVSYTNNYEINKLLRRRIHFPIPWISQLASNVADWLDEQRIKQGKKIFEQLKIPYPASWWIP